MVTRSASLSAQRPAALLGLSCLRELRSTRNSKKERYLVILLLQSLSIHAVHVRVGVPMADLGIVVVDLALQLLDVRIQLLLLPVETVDILLPQLLALLEFPLKLDEC